MTLDPEMLAGLARLSELKAEDLTPEQREAVAKAIVEIDKVMAMAREMME